MSFLPASEILAIFDIAEGQSGTRAVVDFSKRDHDEDRHGVLFRAIAGADAAIPARVSAVNAYIVYDAAIGKELDIPSAVERASKLAGYNFSESARSEREAARAERKAKTVEKAAAKAERASVPYETVAEDGTIKRRAGRPPAGTVPTYDKVKAAYRDAPDRGKDVMLPFLQTTFGLSESSATVYWYRAKKELAAEFAEAGIA